MKKTANYPVRTSMKTLDIIELLTEMEEAGVTELAEALDMSKSIVHNHLSTLAERGYVLRSDGQYQLSFKFLEIGGIKRHRSRLYHVSRPEVEKLAKETKEVANLATMEQGLCIYLHVSKGENAVKLEVIYEGQYEHMHSTAMGKAILAHLPPSEMEDIVELRGLPRITEHTITDPETLYDQFDDIVERGYAIDDGETIPGLRCIAAPIMAEDSTVIGAISISGPASRLQGERFAETIPTQIQNTKNVIEINMQYSNPDLSSTF